MILNSNCFISFKYFLFSCAVEDGGTIIGGTNYDHRTMLKLEKSEENSFACLISCIPFDARGKV